MFDEQEGQTHSENDGCGEAAHNCNLCYGKGYSSQLHADIGERYNSGYYEEKVPCKCKKPIEIEGTATWSYTTESESLGHLIRTYVRDLTTVTKRLTMTKSELRRAFKKVAWLALQEAEIEACKKCQKKIIKIKADLYK
jgi:hypothetical protein